MRAAPPITAADVAYSLADLTRDRHRIVARRVHKELRDTWDYTLPDDERAAWREAVRFGKVHIVAGRDAGGLVLFAKLAGR
jgi:hypothetical protein